MALTEEQLKEVNKKIAEAVKKAYDALAEAEQIANETGVPFSFSPAYGMGGYYNPPKDKAKESGKYVSDWYESGWQSSSSSC